MMTRILKWIMPKPEKIATILVDEVAKAVNNSNKTELISKYGTISDKIVSAANDITKIIKDGTISNEEKMLLVDNLTPVISKVM